MSRTPIGYAGSYGHERGRRRALEEQVTRAVQRFLKEQWDLLEVDANERSVTHHLANYFAAEFPAFDVDCEYNRDGYETKMLKAALSHKDLTSTDTDAKSVFPDVIVHHRRSRKQNHVVIEVKMSTNKEDDAWDKAKLRAFRDTKQYGYSRAVFMRLQAGTGCDARAALEFIGEDGEVYRLASVTPESVVDLSPDSETRRPRRSSSARSVRADRPRRLKSR